MEYIIRLQRTPLRYLAVLKSSFPYTRRFDEAKRFATRADAEAVCEDDETIEEVNDDV